MEIYDIFQGRKDHEIFYNLNKTLYSSAEKSNAFGYTLITLLGNTTMVWIGIILVCEDNELKYRILTSGIANRNANRLINNLTNRSLDISVERILKY